jgi:hypothetical protein
MRVIPTDYTITSQWLKSWVVESSLDGGNWIEIDRNTDNSAFTRSEWEAAKRATFTVSNRAGGRFIRLTMTGENHGGNNRLSVYGFELFGTLVESPE